jgi:NADPH-dependent 7-cyano-7-deazaguanine reductase QueF
MCPISGNPQEGSLIIISYHPRTLFLEVDSLQHYILSYKGGRGDIRDMEGMIQQIAQDCAQTIQTRVTVKATINLQRGASMTVVTIGRPE